jgi:hypothetical protein
MCRAGRLEMEQRLARRKDVAQIFNLPYRGSAIRRPPRIRKPLELSNALPNAIRRYGRVQLCATSEAKLAHALQKTVAQIFNLPYRGSAIRRPPRIRKPLELPNALPNTIRRYSRVQLCVTSKAKLAHALQKTVAQIFNLPYRGFAVRRPPRIRKPLELPDALPNAIRRYGRVQLCATLRLPCTTQAFGPCQQFVHVGCQNPPRAAGTGWLTGIAWPTRLFAWRIIHSNCVGRGSAP